jgi:hypothetical protein
MTTARQGTTGHAGATRLLAALALLAPVVAMGPAACGKGAEPAAQASKLCDPGENIFCRCVGGAAGTKQCKADGQSFDACVGRDGPCTEPSTTTGGTTTTTTPAGTGGAGGTGTGGGGAGGAGTGGGPTKAQYLEPCAHDADCASGRCPMGYCTKDCAKPDECKVDGKWVADCIAFLELQVCMPTCLTMGDCSIYGGPSDCGFTHSVDGVPDTVCADWGPDLEMPPNGTTCFGDGDCNLGHLGAQRICVYDKCGSGCHVTEDCPQGSACSGVGGTPGTCK